MPDGSEQPIFDFAVLSVEREGYEGPSDWTETVYRFTSWDPPYGDPIGQVRITEPGGKRFVARFTFQGSRPVTVTGEVPETDGTRWVGRGRAQAKDDGREKDIEVESRNPKKWG